MKINPNDFLLNTDYEMDKIILVKTGDYIGSKNIDHGLKFSPLIFGVWSTDPDFVSGNTLGPYVSAEPIPGFYTPPLGVSIVALNDHIEIISHGENADTTKIYYRIYALAPDGTNVTTPATSKHANQFVLNTDYNYRKLKAKGTFTQENESFAHNLGYKPQVMAWIKYAEIEGITTGQEIEPITDISLFTNFYLKVTDTTIGVGEFPFGLIDKIYWRIYYDEA